MSVRKPRPAAGFFARRRDRDRDLSAVQRYLLEAVRQPEGVYVVDALAEELRKGIDSESSRQGDDGHSLLPWSGLTIGA